VDPLCDGYLNDPVATARAWRNGWFHTGDLFRRDADDNYFFVRSRQGHDPPPRREHLLVRGGDGSAGLSRCARRCGVPVPGDGGEDEVLAVLSLQAGAVFDPAALIAFLQPRMAAFMIPRYVRVVPELPLTATQKIEKHLLRTDGLTADTWIVAQAD